MRPGDGEGESDRDRTERGGRVTRGARRAASRRVPGGDATVTEAYTARVHGACKAAQRYSALGYSIAVTECFGGGQQCMRSLPP